MDRSPRGREAGERTGGLGARCSPSILVLFSDTGGGHRAAARALNDALRRIQPDVRVTCCDPLIGQGRPIVRRVVSLYPKVIKHARPAWGAIFHASNTAPAFAAIQTAFGRNVRSVLARQLAAADPDVVLSVHPLLNHVAGAAIRRDRGRRGLVVVVTDLIDLHRGWAFAGADLVVLPTEEARRAALRRGVPGDRARLLGLPVDMRFRPPADGESQALRRRWGLHEDRPTVLVVGGGEGSGGLLQQVRELACEPHDWQVIAVCGRNETLRRRLAAIRFGTPTLVLGFVDNMPELLRASDLVVTKAGPGAIAEALATGVPMVLTGFLPGQETSNIHFAERARIAVYAPRPEQMLQAVRDLLTRDGVRYRAMAGAAASLSRPNAALDIARETLELAARYSAASQTIR